jgi:hypothetical protein
MLPYYFLFDWNLLSFHFISFSGFFVFSQDGVVALVGAAAVAPARCRCLRPGLRSRDLLGKN